MKFKFNFFNKRIVISWLVSYLVVFSIPVISSLILYSRAEITLEKEIQNSSNRMLESLQMSADEMLYTISASVMNISSSSEMNTLIGKTESDNEEEMIPTVIRLTRVLNSYKNHNEKISDVFVYFNHLKAGIADSYFGDTDVFFNTAYKDTDVDFSAWLSIINEQNYSKNLIISSEGIVTGADFVYSLPVNSSYEISATVIIRVDAAVLESMILDFNTLKDQSIYILDNNNNRIFVHGNDVFPDIKYEDFPEDFNVVKIGKYRTLSKTSAVNSWRYISVVPQKTINIQLGYLRYLIIINLFFCIIIGGVLVVYFIRKHYKPIAKLLSLGQKKVNNKLDNDYLLLNELMKDYADTKSQLSTIKYNQKRKSKAEVLEILIKGNLQSYKNIQSEFDRVELKFISDCFVVAVFKLENEEALFEYDEGLDIEERDEAIQIIMSNVLEELTSVVNRGHVLKSDGNIICIVNLSASQLSSAKQDIETAFSEAKLFIEDNFSVSFKYYISDIHKSFENIAEAYEQALSKTDESGSFDSSADLIEKIKIYISENYDDNNLNVASVGDHFNITPYYASNVFKRATDISMLDYIGKYRINKAKEIIKNHNTRLASVAELVGFNNVRTFMRSFVKYEGITPGQYKEIIKN